MIQMTELARKTVILDLPSSAYPYTLVLANFPKRRKYLVESGEELIRKALYWLSLYFDFNMCNGNQIHTVRRGD